MDSTPLVKTRRLGRGCQEKVTKTSVKPVVLVAENDLSSSASYEVVTEIFLAIYPVDFTWIVFAPFFKTI